MLMMRALQRPSGIDRMGSISTVVIDSIDWTCDSQGSQVDPLVPIELEASISINHYPTVELGSVRNISRMGG
jgi:hypothetical protein